MSIVGLHHISLISRDAQRTLDFYVQVLGLRLVKQTVNFDNPAGYHLYFGDDTGRPGTLVTFFPLPRAAAGRPGIGGTHHFTLQVADIDNLLRWKRRLREHGVVVSGPLDHHSFHAIFFRDPDGTAIEIATRGPGWHVEEVAEASGVAAHRPEAAVTASNRGEEASSSEAWSAPVTDIMPGMSLRHMMHHITAISSDLGRTHAFFGELLGMHLVKKTNDLAKTAAPRWYWSASDGKPGTLISYIQRDAQAEAQARLGAGQAHHFALTVADEATQVAWRERLLAAGHSVTPVLDRRYFKSIYTTDPDGHIVELATAGPGFFVDESEETLGTGLQLPPWLEAKREQIVAALPPLRLPQANHE